MAKLAKPTKGDWYDVFGVIETEADDVPDVASCFPECLGQGHHKIDFNTVAANARLMSRSKDMVKFLRSIKKQLSGYPEFALLSQDINDMIASTRVTYRPEWKDLIVPLPMPEEQKIISLELIQGGLDEKAKPD